MKTFAGRCTTRQREGERARSHHRLRTGRDFGPVEVQVWVSSAGKGGRRRSVLHHAPWAERPSSRAEEVGRRTWRTKRSQGHNGFDGPAGRRRGDAAGESALAALLPGLPRGVHAPVAATIDAKGQAQPMPRPFKRRPVRH